MRILLGIVGVGLALISSFFVVNAIHDLMFGSNTGPGVLAGLLVFFLGTGFSGIMMAKAGLSKNNKITKISEFEQEQLILSLAKKMNGKLSVSEVALNCHISIDESKKTLDKMTLQGVAELKINDDGSFHYQFVGFSTNQENEQEYYSPNTEQRQNPPGNKETN